jgi:hypothetical protein
MQKIHQELYSLLRTIATHGTGVQFDGDTYDLTIENNVTLMQDDVPALSMFISGFTNQGIEAGKANIQVKVKRTPSSYMPVGIPFPKHQLEALDVAHRPKATYLMFIDACMAAGMNVSTTAKTDDGMVVCLWGVLGDYGYEAELVIAKTKPQEAIA